MLPDAPPYMKWDEEVARQLTEHNERLLHLESLEDRGYTAGARVFNSVAVLLLPAIWTVLPFDSEDYDTDGIHSVFINTSRLTCQTAGKYYIFGAAQFAANAAGVRLVALFFNAAAHIADQSWDTQQIGGWDTRVSLSTGYDLVVGDFVELRVIQTNPGNLNIHDFILGIQRIG